jgi:hypothetical protein
MIENATSMDHPVAKTRGLSLRAILLLVGGGVLVLGFAAAIPACVLTGADVSNDR